ncbi:keratin, type I cytoskeletal 9-like isoform X3 [Coccinella septempunctata]|uniref:keratin, type I cytoskeletal 9-like isoform X3 n=1 Tax=Coccinella septempunctata TaxID=41139 RepID=UPI001D07EBAF|nr:keratin, type I cytoskeletal 9-like isoform X3 [Coccinella septempunctata]
MVNYFASAIVLLGVIYVSRPESVNLPDLDPQDAQQIIEQQDTSLNYAPKVESNVPAVRYLGNEPHNVVEDIYLANQYHGQDGLGGYLYGYSVPDIAKTEKKKAGGDLRGAYNYIAGNGQEIKVEYWDDGTGFHQIDNVPKNLPEDLPAVKAEKERFLKRWQEEAERNSRPVEDPYNSEGQYKEGPLSVQGQLQRQQQFAAQFGKSAVYKQPVGAASQQSAIYHSNLEPYSANYQPYQGRNQQNIGAYQSKQYSSHMKGPHADTGYGQSQTSGGYGSSGSGGYGSQSSGGYGQAQSAYGNQGKGQGSVGYSSSSGYGGQSSGSTYGYAAQKPAGGQSAYGGQSSGGYSGQSSGGAAYGGQSNSGYGAKPAVGASSGYGGHSSGYGNQPSTGTSAYGGQSTSAYGAKPAGGTSGYGGQSSGYGGQSSAYGGQPSTGTSAYGAKPASGGSGYGGQSSGYGGQSSSGTSAYGGQSTSAYGAKPVGGGSGYGGQSSGAYGGQSGYGQASGGYSAQPSQNVNKYAALQAAPYGQASDTHSKYISSQGQEDDGSYKPEKDEEQGPPRGFFYKFDYPVGIIVSKQGPAQGGYGQGGYQAQEKKHGSY